MLQAPDTRLAPRAYERLLALILSGELRPGDLVNERRLADLLGMSRTPVRDALLMLENEGLLERQGNRGLQVKQMRIEDYMEALQVRMLGALWPAEVVIDSPHDPENARIRAGG